MIRNDAICGDKTCYRGTYGLGQGYLFKDGPCDAPNCQWPKERPTRPHFTDGPQHSIVDAGAVALEEVLKCRADGIKYHKSEST